MTDKKKVSFAKISKNYSRKVGLKPIVSEFQNIERGTFVSAIISFSNEEEFKEKCRFLSRMAFEETEEDIRETLIQIKKMSNNPDQALLLGLGPNLKESETKDLYIEGLDDFLDEEVPNGPVLDLEEVDEYNTL